MASIATVVTMGYGSFGSVNLLPTLGYGIAIIPSPDTIGRRVRIARTVGGEVKINRTVAHTVRVTRTVSGTVERN